MAHQPEINPMTLHTDPRFINTLNHVMSWSTDGAGNIDDIMWSKKKNTLRASVRLQVVFFWGMLINVW